MKIVCFTMSWWDNLNDFNNIRKELNFWKYSVESYLNPVGKFIACGTYSDPQISDLGVPIVNAHVKKTLPHDPYFWNYALCAETAGMYYALFNYDFDILAQVCSDSIINSNVLALCEEFMARPETVMAPRWWYGIEDAFVFYKKDAVVKYLNTNNIRHLTAPGSEPQPESSEYVKAAMFGEEWWKIWPERENWRMEGSLPSEPVITNNWPFVIRPTTRVVDWHWLKNGLDPNDIPESFKIRQR